VPFFLSFLWLQKQTGSEHIYEKEKDCGIAAGDGFAIYTDNELLCPVGICQRHHQPNGKGIFQDFNDEQL